jgi:flagellar hook protein FlgE
MSTLTGHLSLYATQSLKAIDNWMNVTQGNIGGSLRTSYKEVELMYGGNLTHELRPVSQSRNGVQIAEQTLTTGNTRIDWSQGEIIKSTQDSHFAINGEGFFLVADFPQRNDYQGHVTNNIDNLYLTRSGDFHWSVVPNIRDQFNVVITEPVLVNNEGLVVMAENDHVGVTTSNNYLVPITQSSITDANGKNRPCIVLPDYLGAGAGPGTRTVDFDELEYSKYGSTIYKAPTAGSFKTIVIGSQGILDRRNIGDVSGPTSLVENALEASNVKIERNITELASMGKIYNGFVQLIKVYNSNLDEVLGFIR